MAAAARRVPALALVGALLALAPGFVSWVTSDARDWAPNEKPEGKRGPSLVARRVRLFEAREPDGRRAWRFEARRIDLDADRRWATLVDVERAVLFRNGKPYLQMSAGSVRFDQQTRDWTARDDLRVAGPDGLQIRSADASWKQGEQKLACPGAVTARFRGADITTVGLAYDARAAELRSLAPVTLQAPHLLAHGSTVRADVKKRTVHFENGVDVTIERPLLEKYGFKR